MMRNKNNILLNKFAMQIKMNCHLFAYLVETAVPPKMHNHLGYFSPDRYIKKKARSQALT